MADRAHLDLLKGGVQGWNEWRRYDLDRPIDLSGADLTDLLLPEVNLYKANLDDAVLDTVDLRWARLTSASLRGAKLRRANLTSSDLNFTHCEGAHFDNAHLIGTSINDAHLSGALLPNANLTGAHLHKTNLAGVNLEGAILERATLVEVNLTGAVLTGCHVYGVSAWDLTLDEQTTHAGLIITRTGEAEVIVDDLEVAQFIYLLLNHRKLRNVLNSVTKRGVLILGRFGDGGIQVLKAVAAKLRRLSYLPMIFDFDRPEARNYTETVKTLVGLARFVVVDLSGPSVPQELYATVPHFRIPFVPILEEGRKPHSMWKDLLEYDNVIRSIVRFKDVKELEEKLEADVVKPAEMKAVERQQRLAELFG
jgi:hypothetical protein